MNQRPAGFDVFVSYAHGDDRQVIHRLVEELKDQFTAIAGRPLSVFLDEEGIPASRRWQQTITSALRASSVMIAVLTERYLLSDWCAQEYELFLRAERDHSLETGSARSIPRIFPVLPAGWPAEEGLTAEQRRRRLDVHERQGVDLSGLNGPAFTREVTRLARDVHAALGRLDDARPAALSPAQDDDTEYPQVTSGYVNEGDRFVSLLAEAVNVTIVGWTNTSLAESLETALERKRSRHGGQAFWRTLRIVFLEDGLLEFVRDEHDAQVPDKETALRRRRQNAGYGRRSLSAFLHKEDQSHRLTLHEYGHIPPFTGTSFEMPDGRRVVQIVIRPPGRSASDHLTLEFADRTDQYFGAAFNDIVDLSTKYAEVLPIGEPDDNDNFHVTEARFGNRVLQDGSRAKGWLPLVLVATWWESQGGAMPLLQFRTSRNAERELDHLSHPTGYITQEDYSRIEEHDAAATFSLAAQAPMAAARRRIALELGADLSQEVTFVRNMRYYHHDKEHLFCWVFDCKLPARFQFPANAEMRPYTLDELLGIRENQVLEYAVRLCRDFDLSRQGLERMARLSADNLTVHGHHDLAEALLDGVRSDRSGLTAVQAELTALAGQTRSHYRTSVGERRVLGLSSLEYREFFTGVLPLYVRLGVPGAVGYLERLEADRTRSAAADRLAATYADAAVMTELPVEA